MIGHSPSQPVRADCPLKEGAKAFSYCFAKLQFISQMLHSNRVLWKTYNYLLNICGHRGPASLLLRKFVTFFAGIFIDKGGFLRYIYN